MFSLICDGVSVLLKQHVQLMPRHLLTILLASVQLIAWKDLLCDFQQIQIIVKAKKFQKVHSSLSGTDSTVVAVN